MNGEIIIPNCACGERMMVAGKKFPPGFVCMNCDGLQEREIIGKERKVSAQDIKFDEEMSRRIESWYPGQPESVSP